MKKLNKALALGMAGAMALSMAACGGNSTSGTASTAGTTSGAADGEVVNLTWVTVGNGQPTNYDAWQRRSASTWTFRSFPGATGTTAATLS